MTMRLTFFGLFWLATACSDFPRDSAGTLDQVRNRRFTVGWDDQARADPQLQALVLEIGARTNSRPVYVSGPTEALLGQAETGELDLVLGIFDRASPWTKRVTFSQPLFAARGGALEGKAALRNGEHAWAITVDRAVKAVRR